MRRVPEPIRSRSHPLVRRLRVLRKDGGRAEGLALLEGVKLLEEAVTAGAAVSEVVATSRGLRDERSRLAAEAAQGRGAALHVVEESVFDGLSEMETSQGLLAVARRPAFPEQRLLHGTPLVVVAVGIQNPGNLGGLLRTAEAAAATGAYLTAGSADVFSWKALRGSMGSVFRLPHVAGMPAEAVLTRLKARGVSVVAATTEGGVRYDAADFRRPVAFLFGNEGAGLPEDVLRHADVRVAIPMHGAVESLNVGVAAGILLFEAARQRRGGPS
jgi:TrmH family RNA methyltransferase